MSKRKPKRLTSSQRRHAEFMVETLAPDLKESGRVHTAEDVDQCGRTMLRGGRDHKHAKFLTGTLIPDLRDSGMRDTAKDLARCARFIGRR